jgi:hypothetical protein
MKIWIVALIVMTVSAMSVSGAEQTWTGRISDSNCGAIHKSVDEHGGKAMTDRQCAQACIKGGATYVFVNDGNVYKIENQDFAGLPLHAGHTVTLKGEMKGDTINVSSIAMNSTN